MSSLNIGARALTTNLAALQVIGHNIANVNTAGYSRQSVQLTTAGAQAFGNGYIGKGVDMATVERSHNAYLTREAQLTASVAAADSVRYSRLQALESAFPLGASGLGAALNDTLNAWNDVASAPNNLTARVVVIAKGEEFASRLRNTAGQLDALSRSTQQQVQGTVDVINGLAQDLAKINQRIVESAGGEHTPNDLFDQRDQMLGELSQHIQTSTIFDKDGAVSVFVAGSQPLLLGQRASQLAVTRDATDNSRIGVSFVQGSVSTPLPDSTLGGGGLSGLMNFLNTDLVGVQNLLGRMALASATSVNDQHRLGIDLQGNPGQDFFIPPAAATGLPAPTNTGNAVVSASVSDPTALMASDYELRFSAAGVSVVRLSDGDASVPAPGTSFVKDGLTFNIDAGAGAAGDRILVRPFEAAARNLQLAIGSPDRLAAASPVLVTPALANSGGLSVESLYASSGSASLTNPVSLTFQANGTFEVSGVMDPANPPPDNPGPPATWNFAPGQPIVLNGWSLTLRGSPSPGDRFDIAAAPPGSTAQNAGNASAVLALHDRPTFEGVPLADGYVSLFSDVGTRVQGAKFAADFSGQIATTAETARTNVSGVNLDEEAARLLQYQQAYQASAKFLQVAQSTFDSLLATVGR
ncbi:MAG: flagellar hook-associated protein FlgK [Hydrogenophaga sp.]|uniref:flagellar hook-associated protein FlgK n=1 Tax=Hydrogenophaga sp. TaxID=1904254 RepID=UPI0026230843|nr:flagellar hook-associated protein FlgK [Hydrogenophaga sp.]MDM7941021.1 flagellar hook-associated protein FlgK [Hydrogenophaga sp.]